MFFQQKNLVIFPYVDLKYLQSLELYTVGYNTTPLEGTALNNLKEVIEFEASNSYSQNKTFYFVYNLDREKLSEIMKVREFRCIINTNENVANLANGTDFIFYNKKNKTFLNFKPQNNDLKLEEHLISTSPNRAILHNKIQEIMSLGAVIFTELNENLNLDNISEILKDYDPQYWEKILKFVENYYEIEIPDIDFKKNKIKNRHENLYEIDQIDQNDQLQDFSDEYQTITSENKQIAREFIQLLFEFRSKHVNPSNLDLEQLYDPQKLYIYLRTHHWKTGISKDFLTDWIKMSKTGYQLTNEDVSCFIKLFKELDITNESLLNSLIDKLGLSQNTQNNELTFLNSKFQQAIPPIKNFPEFKKWILKKLDSIVDLMKKRSKGELK